MATYCISFRIADQIANGRSYNERRQSLIDSATASDGGYWDSTTSFILVESPLHTVEFAKSVCSGLSREHDTAVVFDPGDMSMCYFGQVPTKEVLKSFFVAPTAI